jgi:hypothetical protein
VIITEQKPFTEIVAQLEGRQRVYIVGCGVCATTWETGSESRCQEMAQRLTDAGKEAVGYFVTKESCCDERTTRLELRRRAVDIGKADALLVLACGAGTQTVAALTSVPTYPGLNSLYLARLQRLTKSDERCIICGDCILGETAGICPLTICTKGLRNGPCGGYRQGKCEVDINRDCGWILIYNRMKELGLLANLATERPPKDYSKAIHPRWIDKSAVRAPDAAVPAATQPTPQPRAQEATQQKSLQPKEG